MLRRSQGWIIAWARLTWAFCVQVERVVKEKGGGDFCGDSPQVSVSWVTLLKRGSVPSVFAVQSDPRTLRHGVRRIPLASACAGAHASCRPPSLPLS